MTPSQDNANESPPLPAAIAAPGWPRRPARSRTRRQAARSRRPNTGRARSVGTVTTRHCRRLAAFATAILALPLDGDDLTGQIEAAAARVAPRSKVELRILGQESPRERLGLPGRTAELVFPAMRAGDLPAERRALASGLPEEQDLDESSLPWPAVRALAAIGKRRTLVAPLPAGDRPMGFVHLWSPDDERPYTAADRRLAGELGRLIGAMLSRTNLLEQTQQRLREQEGLLRVSRATASSLEPPTVLEEVATAALGVAGAECCALMLWQAESNELELGAEATVADWPGVDRPGFRYSLETWAAARTALTNRQTVCHQAGDRAMAEYERVSPTAHGVQSLLLAPLVNGGDCLGLLLLGSRRVEAFGPPEVRLARDVAAQASLAIQNMHLLAATRRHVAEQSALVRASQAVISNHDVQAVLAEIARAGLSVANLAVCTVEVWHRPSDELEVAAVERDAAGVGPKIGDRAPLTEWPASLAALAGRRPLAFLTDASFLSPRERQSYAAQGIGSVLMVPLLLGNECLGKLTLSTRERRVFDGDLVRFGQDLAAQAAQALDRDRLHSALREQANSDGLTGLLNHRAIQEALDDHLARARSMGTTLAVFLIDIDDFKLFNDTHGHQVGDRVLVQTAALLREVVGVTGRVGRYGGDEFLVIFPSLGVDEARQTAARLLARATATTIAIDHLRLPLKLSVGVAVFPHDGRSRRDLIAAADAAMYAAKEAGGGQIGSEGRFTRSLEESPFGSLLGLVRAVDRKDRYTRRHSDLVTAVAVRFARDLNLPLEEIEALEIAGPLHDVGKIVVPDAILRKPGKLTMEELAIIRQHVTFGELIVQGVGQQAAVQAAIAHHHERWDGTGYPRGRAGNAIPRLGRLLALADAYAAMIHDRPYRKGRSIEETIAAIRSGAGSQFDPLLTEPFIATITVLAQEARRCGRPVTDPPPLEPEPAPKPRAAADAVRS